MDLTVSALVVDCADPAALAAFWQSVLGGTLVPYPDIEVVALRAPGVTFDFARVTDEKVVKNRWHIDLATADHDQAVAHVLERGASLAPDVYDGDEFTVLRDPEGNEFCVLRHGSTTGPWGPPS